MRHVLDLEARPADSSNTSTSSVWQYWSALWSHHGPDTARNDTPEGLQIEQSADTQYRDVLAASTADDFSDLQRLEFLRCSGTDKEGHRVIVIIARNYKAADIDAERAYHYFIHCCDAAADDAYSVVLVHTNATYWQNSPSIMWLWRKWQMLPQKYRDNLKAVYVLHADLQLWLTASAVCPWLSGNLWSKITFVPRVEFLDDVVDRAALQLPSWVAVHDDELEEQPLMDYGIVASKEALPPMPLSASID